MVNKQFPTINLEATGRQIAKLRRAKGLTVRDMQDYFGFEAPQAIYKWQKGLTLPSVDNLFALSALLEVPLNEILVANAAKHDPPKEPECSVFFALKAGFVYTKSAEALFFCLDRRIYGYRELHKATARPLNRGAP